MVRRGWEEYQGAVYYVIQRWNNKSIAMDGVEIYSYVIMNNHYHLALRTGAEKLSKVMHRINTKYSMYYNRFAKSQIITFGTSASLQKHPPRALSTLGSLGFS